MSSSILQTIESMGCLAKVEVPKSKQVKIDPKLLITYLLNKLIIVVHIVSLYINLKFKMYIKEP